VSKSFSEIRVGLIARADLSGLGFQCKALYDLLKPHKTIIIDSTPLNGREQNFDWYPTGIVNNGLLTHNRMARFLTDIDVLITCEVPYSDNLYHFCRRRGIKTILQPNAELNPHILNKQLPLPDVFFMPSPWLEDETRSVGVPCYLVKPPIVQPRNPRPVVSKHKGQLKVLHFGGRRAAHDRNGTEIVRSLPEIDGVHIDIHDQIENEVKDQRDLYEQGHHVILIPRRYGGLCLPMLESLSYELPVIMPNIEPNRQELPAEWLTTASRGQMIRTKHRIETYNPDPQSIVWMLEKFRDMNQEEYNHERNKAKMLYNSHQEQLSNWQTYIEKVVNS